MWHPEEVEPWSIGLVAVVALGLAAIVYGALADRTRNRRAAAEMLAPPRRIIPHFDPRSPSPTYLSELQARRAPEGSATAAASIERDELVRQLKDPTTLKLSTGYLSRDFVTDAATGQAVLDRPRVLICSDRIESTRELLPVLERCSLSGTPLVVLAPAISDEVRSTLEVNQIQQRLRVVAVVGADAGKVATATGAAPRDQGDLQSGYVWPEHLGSCERWVSTSKASYVVGGRSS